MINRINDVHVGLTSLQNPHLPSLLPSVSLAFSFCKWSALILALVATFGSLITKINVHIITFRRHPLPSTTPLNGDDYSSSDDEDDDEDDEETSSSSEFEEEEEEDERTPSSLKTSFNRRVLDDYDQIVDQSTSGINNGKLKRRRSICDIFSLSEIVNNKNVVKLWDTIGFGLGLDFDDVEDYYAGSLARQPPYAAEDVFLTAEKNGHGKTAVTVWDSRIRRRLPAVIAEWKPNMGNIVNVGFGEVETFYVRGDVNNDVMVGDLRNVSMPLEDVKECDGDIWWDSDAVILSSD